MTDQRDGTKEHEEKMCDELDQYSLSRLLWRGLASIKHHKDQSFE